MVFAPRPNGSCWRLATLGVLAVVSSHCGGDGYSLLVRFDTPELAARANRVELSVVASCDVQSTTGEEPIDTIGVLDVERGQATQGVGDLAPGSYGIYARAWTLDCEVIAAGCTPITVEAGGEGILTVEISGIAGPGCVEGTACADGWCRALDWTGCFDAERCNGDDDDCDDAIDEDFDPTSDAANCGVCGNVCDSPLDSPGWAVCEASACALACPDAWVDCDVNVDNGCEIDTATDVNNCGGCGIKCNLAHGEGSCVAGACSVQDACVEGYLDTDGIAATGCERCSVDGADECSWACGDTMCRTVRALAVGDGHACAVVPESGSAGDVICWGRNSAGQLGSGAAITDPDRAVARWPFYVSEARDEMLAGQLALGTWHSCAGLSGSDIACWGSNADGRLGVDPRPEPDFRYEPVRVAFGGEGRVAAGSDHTCLYTAAGVLCWGNNDFGQLGDSTIVGHSTPLPVTGLEDGVDSVSVSGLASGTLHTCAVVTAGDVQDGVRCWGENGFGQLGDGNAGGGEPVTTPVQVVVEGGGNLEDVSEIAAGDAHTCAVYDVDATVACWGANNHGQLGIRSVESGTDYSHPLPQVVQRDRATELAVGANHTCALVSELDAIYCWGANSHGQLGRGTTDDSGIPDVLVQLPAGAEPSLIAAGGDTTCAALVLADGTSVWCWGDNQYGQLGDGTFEDRSTPVRVIAP